MLGTNFLRLCDYFSDVLIWDVQCNVNLKLSEIEKLFNLNCAHKF